MRRMNRRWPGVSTPGFRKFNRRPNLRLVFVGESLKFGGVAIIVAK